MKHPELAKYADRADKAYEDALLKQADREELGDLNAKTAAAYAKAEHIALVIVTYTRKAQQEIDDTGLLSVPPPPKGLQLDWPEGMTWPTGFTVGQLTDGNERKVAARAIVAELQEQRDLALNGFRSAKDAIELAKQQVSAQQSMLRAQTEETKMDAAYDRPPPERSYSAPIGRTPPPPPRRR